MNREERIRRALRSLMASYSAVSEMLDSIPDDSEPALEQALMDYREYNLTAQTRIREAPDDRANADR